MDLTALDRAVQGYFEQGLAQSTRNSYRSAKRRYLAFCDEARISPLPVTEHVACSFVAHLAQQGLRAGSIMLYLSAIRHLQICAGLPGLERAEWPRLSYVLRGIKRGQVGLPRRCRLPITGEIMKQLQVFWSSPANGSIFESKLLWATCCLCFFGFLRVGEATTGQGREASILKSDVAVDSHSAPSVGCTCVGRRQTHLVGEWTSTWVKQVHASARWRPF